MFPQNFRTCLGFINKQLNGDFLYMRNSLYNIMNYVCVYVGGEGGGGKSHMVLEKQTHVEPRKIF